MLIVGFAICTAVILVAGTVLSKRADVLADRTGIGEAVMGGLFLGAVTSLPGITTSVTAAVDGNGELALANAVGGIATQTVFLAVADLFYRGGNLEHAAASAANLLQSALLIGLLGLLLVAIVSPDWSIGWLSPFSPLIVLAYGGGMVLVRRNRDKPMWHPRQTNKTVEDEPEEDNLDVSLVGLWLVFGVCAVLVGLAGWGIAKTGTALSVETGMSQTLVGTLLTSVSTSLPELVTTIVAVRSGAVTLAVGGIIGGNAFDTLFACVADAAYTPGSLFAAGGPQISMLIALGIVLNAIILMGLLHRQSRGLAGIGSESVLVIVLYLAGVTLISVSF